MTKELWWYDQLYREGGDWCSFVEEDVAYMLSTVLLHLKLKAKPALLDVGCGAAGLLAKANDMGIQDLVGIDLSPSALERAKSYIREVDFVAADGHHLPFQEKVFDVVTCIGTLEHFNNPGEGAQQMYQSLVDGGACLVALPNPYFAYSLLCKALGKYRYQPIEHDFSFSDWKRCLESAKFSVLRMVPANPRSDSILRAKSIPTLRRLYSFMWPLFRLYDKIRHSLPKLSSYHVMFVLKKAEVPY